VYDGAAGTDAPDDLVAERRVEVHAVGFDERLRRVVSPSPLIPLHFGEQAGHARERRGMVITSRFCGGVRDSIALVCAISQRTSSGDCRIVVSSIWGSFRDRAQAARARARIASYFGGTIPRGSASAKTVRAHQFALQKIQRQRSAPRSSMAENCSSPDCGSR